MSTLAFNKEGEPFSFDERTDQLRARRFRRPGMRGTCEVVLDRDGEQVYVDVDADVPELRHAVDNVPGYYRLDQCDEDGRPIPGLPAAYVSVEAVRNAGASGDADAMAVVRELAAINAEVTKTMADRFAAVMQSTAEILRAADGAGIAHRKPIAVAAVVENDDDDEADVAPPSDEPAPTPTTLASIATIVETVPALVETLTALYTQIKASAAKGAAQATPPAAAAAPASEPASTPSPAAAPSAGPVSDGAAAGSSGVGNVSATATDATAASGEPSPSSSAASPSATTSTTSVAESTTASTAAPPPASSSATDAGVIRPSSTALVTTAPSAALRNAPLQPTVQQWTHLAAIRARLTPKEQAIAEQVIARMNRGLLAQWLVDLSAQSVDQAVQTIRDTIASLERAKHNGRRG